MRGSLPFVALCPQRAGGARVRRPSETAGSKTARSPTRQRSIRRLHAAGAPGRGRAEVHEELALGKSLPFGGARPPAGAGRPTPGPGAGFGHAGYPEALSHSGPVPNDADDVRVAQSRAGLGLPNEALSDHGSGGEASKAHCDGDRDVRLPLEPQIHAAKGTVPQRVAHRSCEDVMTTLVSALKRQRTTGDSLDQRALL